MELLFFFSNRSLLQNEHISFDSPFGVISVYPGSIEQRQMNKIGIVTPDKVTPHDLRRTHGTMITGLGFSREQMNRIQNHREGGVGSIYDRHSYAVKVLLHYLT